MSTFGVGPFDVNDWGGYAVCYDVLNELGPYRELQQVVATELGSLAGQRLLDAGCGTGNLLQILAQERWEGMEIWAFDFSEEMLRRAEQKIQAVSVHFLRADLNQSLPFPGEFFDKIVSVNALYAVTNAAELVTGFVRVLKRGGQLVLVTPKRGYQNGLVLKAHCQSEKPDEYWYDVHRSPEREWGLLIEAIEDPRIRGQMMAIAEYNRQIVATATFHFFEPAELLAMVRNCGFTVAKTDLVYAEQGILVVAQKEG